MEQNSQRRHGCFQILAVVAAAALMLVFPDGSCYHQGHRVGIMCHAWTTTAVTNNNRPSFGRRTLSLAISASSAAAASNTTTSDLPLVTIPTDQSKSRPRIMVDGAYSDDDNAADSQQQHTKQKKRRQRRGNNSQTSSSSSSSLYKLQGRLLKKVRQTCLDYDMLQDGDHIMVCVSGGKDSATLLHLLTILQKKLPIRFRITAVHVNQHQPGYNGTALVEWLEHDYKQKLLHQPWKQHQQDGSNSNNNNTITAPPLLLFDYKIISEDTYSIVVNQTAVGKSYCTVCSRLRRGILYTAAVELGCNKIALGHHADDCLETLLLNMIHGGKMSAMPARYTSHARSRRRKRDDDGLLQGEGTLFPLVVMRPLIQCMEEDIAAYAAGCGFPILPCNLCSNQANLQRPQVKLLLNSLQALTPTAKQNMLNACQTVKPGRLLDQNLRAACGMDPVTGLILQDDDDEELGT